MIKALLIALGILVVEEPPKPVCETDTECVELCLSGAHTKEEEELCYEFL